MELGYGVVKLPLYGQEYQWVSGPQSIPLLMLINTGPVNATVRFQ